MAKSPGTISTDNNSDLFDGDTEFEFKRNVVKVGIKFHDMYGDEINLTIVYILKWKCICNIKLCLILYLGSTQAY